MAWTGSRLLFLCALVLSLLSTRAALAGAPTVNINSGNPRYPFPQFLSYGPGRDNLANTNSPGVPHAEMEQRIRDAWQIYVNSFTAPGPTVGGVTYLRANNGCPYDCTEGEGYGLVAAAYMADKAIFDGLAMRFHDNRYPKRQRFSDCGVGNAGYLYGNTPTDNTDSAADGDFDAAHGFLMAWYQWGDDSGIPICGGGTMNYRTEALHIINAIVEKARHFPLADCRTTSGDIGYDGYIKGGNTWGELTNFATGQCPDGPEFMGATQQHIDYAAPAYFKCFGDFLQAQAQPAFNISQYRKAEVSSDWLMGQMEAQGLLPLAGWVQLTGATPTFSNFSDGEDFRNPWRTVLNYVWNGNPLAGWNPVTHAVTAVGNSYEQQVGQRLATFMADPQAYGPQGCLAPGSSPITFRGPSTLTYYYGLNGAPNSTFTLNWLQGTGAPSAIAAQDFALMGDMFRQNVIEWDITSAGDGYMTSVPRYFHGFFRWLGMHILSGNHLDPCQLVEPGLSPPSNLKIYKSVDKTYAFQGDTLTYWLNYRNYASTTATGVSISDVLPAELGYLSANPAPSSAPAVGSSGPITWNRPNLAGLVNQNLGATLAGITLVARVLGSTGRVCNVSSISTSNGTGWTSNEYPNNVTDVMQRNCVDIVAAALTLTKTASTASVNPGMAITYTIDFENSSEAGWLNGGRPGVVAAFANAGNPNPGDTQWIKVRLYHGADEAYINYRNYRISYFINDAAHSQIGGPAANSWDLANTIYEGGSAAGVSFTQEDLPPGSDANGAWNQRVIIRFSDQLATTANHLYNYYGMGARIHQGGTAPLRAVWRLFTADYAGINWADDWSADAAASQGDGGGYFPITNDWTDPNNPNLPVTRLHPDACETATHTVDNVLVEEWDGYTWRRAFGDGPAPGREIVNARLRDTLSANVDWGGFIETPAVGTTTYNAGTRTVQWDKPTMLVNEGGRIRYYVTVKPASHFGGCPVSSSVSNTATVQGDSEAPVSDSVTVAVTCDPVPTPTPAPSTLTKTASTSTPANGANVTWTLDYTQQQGTIVDRPAPNAGNWTGQSGSAFTYGATTIANVSNQSQVATYNYSHGTNGTITATVNLASYAAFGVSFRHTGGAIGNGLYMVFKHNPPNSEVRFYNGTTQIGTTHLVSYGTSFDFKLVLTGGTANLWINTLTGPPLLTQTGIPVRAGYAGVINGFPTAADTFGSHTLSNWYTNLDSAFNLQISDPVPGGLSFVSANNGGSFGAGRVSWPTVAGPVLAGTSYSHQWVSTVSGGCGSSITNTAYANMLGQPADSIGDAAVIVVTCSGSPTFTPTQSPTATVTRSATPSATRSASPSPSPSGTPTASATQTATPSTTRSATPTRTASPTVTVTFLDTYTVTRTESPSATVSPSATLSPSPSATRSATPSATASHTASPIASATSTPSETPSHSASPSPSATRSATPTATGSATPTWTATATPSRTATGTATPSVTATATGSQTPSSTISPVFTATVTPSVTPTWTGSATPSASPTASATRTATPSATATRTSTETRTATPSPTQSLTRTDSPTQSLTSTLSATASATPSITVTPSISATFTVSPTAALKFYQQSDLIQERGIYPNPFAERAKIYFSLRVEAVAKLTVYNVAGEPLFVKQYPGVVGPNVIDWDGVNDSGARCASGIYILRLQADGVDRSTGGYWATVAIQR